MARSIKSRRGKTNRRVLRERYKKKSEDHLKKIIEKAKKNDLADQATLLSNVFPIRVRRKLEANEKEKAEREKKAKESKDIEEVKIEEEVAGEASKDSEEVRIEEEMTEKSSKDNEEVKIEEEMSEKSSKTKAKRKKNQRQFYNGTIESLRDKRSGKFPKWVSQKLIRKSFLDKKMMKQEKKLRRGLRMF